MKDTDIKWEITSTGEELPIGLNGAKVKPLYGAFGCGKKILTIHQIAKIHADNPDDKKEIKRKVQNINDLINNNIILDSGDKYFEFGIDILDLKQTDSNGLFSNLKKMGLYTQAQIGNANNLYVLSEQGYSLLISLMKDSKSKVIYKQVVRDYFRMKEILLSSEDSQQYIIRLLGKEERKRTTDTIKYFIETGELSYHNPKDKRTNAYAIETNYIYKILFNMTAKEIEGFLSLQLKECDTVRNYLSLQDIKDIRLIEGRVAYMMEDGKTFAQIKQRLKDFYPVPRRPKLADKSIPLINRLMLQSS